MIMISIVDLKQASRTVSRDNVNAVADFDKSWRPTKYGIVKRDIYCPHD